MSKISRRTARRGGKDVSADAKLLELEKQLTELREEEAAIREPLKGVWLLYGSATDGAQAGTPEFGRTPFAARRRRRFLLPSRSPKTW